MPVNKKKTTIDDLALMVKGGFDDVDKRFNKRFDKIEKKVTDNRTRIEGIFAKLVSLDRRMMYIEDRLTEIVKQNEKEFSAIKKDLKEIKNQKKIDEKRVLNLEKRIEKLELKYV